jgi:dihydroneopterin aldolase/2-amino-4-hydroxy-6-hydroxymethyldihydropteridine diphosphokinase
VRDRIEIRGLRLLGHHGVLPREQDRPQPFSIDIDVEIDSRRAAACDELASSVDYGRVVGEVSRVVTTQRFGLLESLAERIAQVLLALDGVAAVRVGVGKLRPPIDAELAHIGVRIERVATPVGDEVLLALGSNLGDRWAMLIAAVEALSGLDPELSISPIYETAPVGGRPGQGPYLNCVVRLFTDRSPRELLRTCQELENRAGRVREERNGPRPLDVDLLFIGDRRIDEPDLVVPHPRIASRPFVLRPLEDLVPARVPPGSHLAPAEAAGLTSSLRPVGRLLRGRAGGYESVGLGGR